MAESDFRIEIGELRIGGLDIPSGLRVKSVRFDGAGLLFNPDSSGLKWPKGGNLVVEVSMVDLQAYVNQQKPGGLRDYRVSAQKGAIDVSATRPGLIPLHVQARCSLEVVDSKLLHIKLDRASVFGANVSSFVRNAIEESNPLFSVDEIPFPVKMNSVEISEWEIRIHMEVVPGGYPP